MIVFPKLSLHNRFCHNSLVKEGGYLHEKKGLIEKYITPGIFSARQLWFRSQSEKLRICASQDIPAILGFAEPDISGARYVRHFGSPSPAFRIFRYPIFFGIPDLFRADISDIFTYFPKIQIVSVIFLLHQAAWICQVLICTPGRFSAWMAPISGFPDFRIDRVSDIRISHDWSLSSQRFEWTSAASYTEV